MVIGANSMLPNVTLDVDVFLVIDYAVSLTAILILFDIVWLSMIGPAACVISSACQCVCIFVFTC